MRLFSWIPGIVFILISFTNADAQDCFDYADQLRLEKTYSESFWTALGIDPAFGDVEAQGGFAYVADNTNGLVVLNVADVLNITISSITAVNFYPISVQVSGDIVLLAGFSDLQLIDASNPESPLLLGQLSINFEGGDLQVSENIAYFESGNGGLCRVDFSDPNEPFELPLLENPPLNQIQTNANQLLVLDISGYKIFDTSGSDEPVLVSFLAHPAGSDFYRFAVNDDLVYFTTYPEDFYIADFSDLNHPQVVQTINDSNWPSGGVPFIQDDLMFILGSNQLLTLNISNPHEPQFVGGCWTGVMPSGAWVNGARFLTLRDSGSLKVFDTTNPASIQPQARVLLDEPFSCMVSLPNHANAFMAAVGTELVSYYLPDPLQPQAVNLLDMGGEIWNMAIEGDYLYVAAGEAGLVVVSVVDPINPEIIGSVFPSPNTNKIQVDNGVALVNGGSAGNLVVVDVTDPASPQIRGNVNTSNSWSPFEFILNNDFAYWINLGGNLGVLDISDLDHPEEISADIHYYDISDAPQMFIHQDILFIAGRALGRMDVSNPEYPVLLDKTYGAHFRDFELSGGRLYGPSDVSGFMVVDVESSDEPVMMGQTYQWEPSSEMAQAAGWFYVADDTGINIYPSQCQDSVPVFLSSFQAVAQEDKVDISWQVSSDSDVVLFRLTGATDDRTWTVSYEVESYGLFSANDLTPVDNQVTYSLYLKNSDGHWHLLDSRSVKAIPSAGINRVSAVPNPFNPNTRISFTTNSKTPISLNIYDLNGRLVASLFSGIVQNHHHEVVWNGTDDLGKKLPSGTYFANFQGEGFSVSRKLVLVK